MPTNRKDLLYAIRAQDQQFQQRMARVNATFAETERKGEKAFRDISRASDRAARQMHADFERANGKVAAQFARVRGVAASGLGALGVGAGAGLLAGFGGAAAVRDIREAASSIADLNAEAERAGLTFEQFQGLKFAFAQEKVNIDALTDGFKELQLRADEFITTGKGSGEEAFRRLGFGAQELSQALKDPEELFYEIIERLQNFDRAAQIRIADEIFGGTGGEQFVQLLDAGPEKLREAAARARELGIILSNDVGSKAADVDRRFQAIEQVLGTAIKRSLVDIGETVVDVGEKLVGWFTAARNFSDELGAGVELSRQLDAQAQAAIGTLQGVSDAAGETEEKSQGTVRTFERQVEIVEQLQRSLARANQEAALAEANGAADRLQQMRDYATTLLQRLTDAKRVLFEMQGITINFGGDGAPPGIGPSGGPASGISTNDGRGARGIVAAAARSGVNTAQLTDAVANGLAKVLVQFPGLTVNSGYRSEAYNRSVKGAPNSRHIQKDAVDIGGVNASNVGAIVRALQAEGFRGFGYYNNGSLHADMGPRRAWGPNFHGSSLGETPQAFRDAVVAGPAITPEIDADLYRQNIAQQDRDAAQAAQERIQLLRDEQDARDRQREAIQQVNEALAEELEMAGLEKELLESGKFTLDEVNAALDQESLVREKLNQLQQAGVPITTELEQSIRSQVDALFALREASDQAVTAQQNLAARSQELQGAFTAIGQPIVDTFLSIASGAENAEDAIKRLVLQFANMALQGALFGQGPLGSIFGGGLLGSLFPGRAGGGPVQAGQPYIVGEEGEELFVPGVSGRIVDAGATRAALAGASRPIASPAASAGQLRVAIELLSKFSDDGGFQSAVERYAGPVAKVESRKAADSALRAVPSIVDQRNDERSTRRIRPRTVGGSS